MMKDVAKALAGGAVLYLVMAACSASDGGSGWVKNGASGGGFGGGGGSSLFDALTDPVPNAEAGEPQVAQASCDIAVPKNGSTFYYAEHLYPGKTKAELVLVRAFSDFNPDTAMPQGYADYVNSQQYLGDGKVLVFCGMEAGHTATFVLP